MSDHLELSHKIRRWTSDWQYIAMSPSWSDEWLHPHGHGVNQITLFKTLRNASKAARNGGAILLFEPSLLRVVDGDDVVERDDVDAYQFAERQAVYWAQRAALLRGAP